MANEIGVKITRSTAGPIAFAPDTGDSLFVAGVSDRGPANVARLYSSLPRFEAAHGGPTVFGANDIRYSDAYEVIRHFFNHGGKQVWFVRCIGAAAVAAKVTLVDRAGAPLPTLDVEAVGPGTWANGLDIVIADGTQADTFSLEILDSSAARLEFFDNLKINSASINLVNNGSEFVNLTDLASASVAPLNLPANGTSNLNDTTVGVDDNNPVAADVVGGDGPPKTGLRVFRSTNFGRGIMTAPGLDIGSATVISELELQSEKFFREYWTSSTAGASVASAKVERATVSGFNVSFFLPRVFVRDLLTQNDKAIPAVGAAAALWFQELAKKGPAKAPAGRAMRIRFIEGLETLANGQPLIDEGIAPDLLANGMCPIYDRNGSGPTVWGARAATTDPNFLFNQSSHLFNRIAHTIEVNLDQLTYEVATATGDAPEDNFFLNARMGVRNFMSDLWAEGAFNGEIPADGEDFDEAIHAFHVKLDSSLLSALDKQQGITRAQIKYVEALTNETMEVEIAKIAPV